jgi:hypothetical protein
MLPADALSYMNAISISLALVSLVISTIAVVVSVKLATRQRAVETLRRYLELEARSARRDLQTETDLKIAFLLLLAQDVLDAFLWSGKRRAQWRGLLKDQLVYYVDELKDRWINPPSGYVAHYGPRVEELVREIISEAQKK